MYALYHECSAQDQHVHLVSQNFMCMSAVCTLAMQGLNGILADEMGLGKTIQVCAASRQLHALGSC